MFVSGGYRSGRNNNYRYDAEKMYSGFGLPSDAILSGEAIRDMDFDVQFSAHTKLIPARNVDRKIQIFHGVSYRNKSVRPENMGCDNYFVVGPYMLKRFHESGLMQQDDSRAVNIGFMKTDSLLNGSLNTHELLASVSFDGSRPVILYAPTGAKLNSLETMGEAVIQALLATDKYDLIIKPHDHPKNKRVNWARYLRRYESAHCRIVPPAADVIPMLFIADLLISDASSVANEYTLLDRPLVFLDTPDLLAQAGSAKNSMLDLDTWGRSGGVIAERPSDVPRKVADCLADPLKHSLMRRKIADDLFFNPGRATETAMDWLVENVLPSLRSIEERKDVSAI